MNVKRLAGWSAASVVGAIGATAAFFLAPQKGPRRRQAATKAVQRERAHVAMMAATVTRRAPATAHKKARKKKSAA